MSVQAFPRPVFLVGLAVCSIVWLIFACGKGSSGGGGAVAPGAGFAPTDSDTRIYGTVIDSAGDVPLSGATIKVDNVQGVVQTDAKGRFVFPVPGQGTYALRADKSGFTYSQRKVAITRGELKTVEDMFLTPLDGKSIRIGPGGGTGSNSDGSMQIQAPAGAVAAETDMRATRYKRGKELPNFLPDLSHFTYACELTPDGQNFGTPVTVRMKNERGFSPGTKIPVGVYSPTTLKWSHESMGTVSANGKWVEFQVTHFSPRDINLSMESPTGSDEPGTAQDISGGIGSKVTNKNNHSCSTVGGGSQIGVADGHLSVDHLLPGYVSRDMNRTIALQYNSHRVNPKPLLGVAYDPSQVTVLPPERIRFVASVGGQRIERFFEPTDGPMRFQYRWDGMDGMGQALPAGTYDYEITLANQYNAVFALTPGFGQPPSGSTGIQADEYVDYPSTFTGQVALGQNDGHAFGAGWDMVGLYRIELQTDAATIVGGDGSSYTFSLNKQGNYVPSDGDFSTLIAGTGDDALVWTTPDLTRFAFDAAGRLRSEADRNGNTTTYAYNQAGRLVTVTDPVGKVTKLAYDGKGRLASITDPMNRQTLFTVNAAGDLKKVTNPDGSTRRFAYDANHAMTAQTDAGGKTTTYVYKPSGALARVERPDGSTNKYAGMILVNDFAAGEGAEAKPFSFENSKAPYFTNGEGERYRFEVNAYGTRTAIIDPMGRRTEMDRDENDLLRVLTLPSGRMTGYKYNANGFLTQYTLGNQQVDITYDANSNLPRTVNDWTIGKMIFTYDAKGNLKTSKQPTGQKFTFAYNAAGQMTSVTTGGQVTAYTYNADGNLETLTDPANDTTTFAYDKYGNLKRIVDAGGRVWSAKYDIMNRVVSMGHDAGDTVKLAYSPAKGSDDTNGSDPISVITTVTDGRGNSTTFGYDAMYRLKSITDALGNKTTFGYDAAGRLTERVQANGKKVTYAYNNAGQMTGKTLSTGEEHTYVYAKATGLLKSATSSPSGHKLEVTMDGYERVAQTKTTFPAQPQPFTVTLDHDYRDYNDYDSYTQFSTSPALYRTIGYEYDTQHGPLPVDRYSGYFWLDLSYDGAYRCDGWFESYEWTEAEFTFDAADRFKSKTFTNSWYHPGTDLFEMSWDYAPGGDLQSMTDPDGTHSYTYDAAGRLLTAAHPPASGIPNEEFTYDKAGNRRIKGSEPAFLFDKANRLLADTHYAYDYDASGNCILKLDLVSLDQTTYAYDAENRLTGITFSNGDGINYIYDAAGRLIEQDKGSYSLRFVNEGDELLAVFSDTGQLIKNYINGPRIDMMEGVQVGDLSNPPNNYFYYTDPLGTPRATATYDGGVQQIYRYEAFGKPVGTATSTRLFAGLLYESNSELYYVRNRFYDPESGRFMQRDPVPLLAAIAPYVYAGNAPTMVRDPFGLAPKNEWDGLKELVKGKAVDPAIDHQVKDTLSNIPRTEDIFGGAPRKEGPYRGLARASYDALAHHGSVAAHGYDQYSQWKDVIQVWTSKCPLEAGMKWYAKQWWNPAGKYMNSVLTMGGHMARRPATIHKIDGLRSGLGSFFGH